LRPIEHTHLLLLLLLLLLPCTPAVKEVW